MIDNLPNIPEQKRPLLDLLVDQLSRITGMAAIVLGGSYASGTHHDGSDIDIGLYYSEARPFSIADIRHIAEGFSVNGMGQVIHAG